MNALVKKLYEIGGKTERTIIGLMSGTSLDGLDIALCRIHGSGANTQLQLLEFTTIPYTDEFRADIRALFAQETISQSKLCWMNAQVADLHSQYVLEALAQWKWRTEDVDLIASHGQTIYHAPQMQHGQQIGNSTLQIGDGDHLAVKTGIITLSDFRQKHVAAGGEGAPLAAYGDYLLYTDPHQDRILLNIGGIANFTYLPNGGSTQSAFATDVGPGNTLMDQYAQAYFGLQIDTDAQIARKGKVSTPLLDALLGDTFFEQGFPKTTGPELFNLTYLAKSLAQSNSENLSHEDIMATLSAFSAQGIARSIQKIAARPGTIIYASGGGIHNPLLMQHIQQALPAYSLKSLTEIGMNPDAKEAALFAILANESVAGDPAHARIADAPAVCMGKVCFPK